MKRNEESGTRRLADQIGSEKRKIGPGKREEGAKKDPQGKKEQENKRGVEGGGNLVGGALGGRLEAVDSVLHLVEDEHALLIKCVSIVDGNDDGANDGLGSGVECSASSLGFFKTSLN